MILIPMLVDKLPVLLVDDLPVFVSHLLLEVCAFLNGDCTLSGS